MRSRVRFPVLALAALVASAAALVAPERESRAADPTTADCLGASETSIKLRSEHRLREARAQLLVCAAASCPADVRNECARRVQEVNAAVPTIVFEAKDQAGNDVAAVRVTMDGKPLVDRLEGTAISLDPGEHVFSFEVPGQPPVKRTIVIREGEKDRRERVIVGPGAVAPVAPAPMAPAPAAPPPASAQPVAPAPQPANSMAQPIPMFGSDSGPSTWSSQKTWALVVGGAGLVGVVVGSVLGASASSSWTASKAACSSATSCPDRGLAVAEHDNAVNSATGSTIGFSVGLVGLTVGTILWLTAPSAASAPPAANVRVFPVVGARANGFAIVGDF